MNKLRVELVYFPGCPHVAAAREALRAALIAEDLPVAWREWNRDDPATPPALRTRASPAILVNGRDIEPAPAGAPACRIYRRDTGFAGAPDVETIRSALRAAAAPPSEPEGVA